MAAAEASLITEMLSTSLAFTRLMSASTPSTRTSGSDALMEVTPRMFREPEEPGLPEDVEMFRPGTAPWSMSVRLCVVRSSRSLVSTAVTAPVRFTFFWTP